MRGDATLFTRNDEAEAQWRIIDPIEHAWAADTTPPATYEAGTQGPDDAADILLGDARWRAI
jgi:glucose-6-phosphate 1-dehydrogenase